MESSCFSVFRFFIDESTASNVQFTAQLQYSRKRIERIALHTTESNKTCANKKQHAFATALTVVDIGHKVYISIAIRNNIHGERTETEREKEQRHREKESKEREREKKRGIKEKKKREKRERKRRE